ncbi:thiol reductase thioredoxin [Arthrobacter sp. MYb224]|uniref:glutaredoxin family protein n=1 Tax=unclassified Arthrobacter TaxID=235627 RepID=UPI000CFBC9A8|nr:MULTISPECIES: thioredoxin family protein [unclassified Arthrobacter]PQZ96893.1 thiol reductase thioredoxin [Arthrobacter sp. MYb224]PQZ97865.1 thiol reductase thioredoxin [Arthrobacter sp. MYb229]PRB46640.1 thiol reductase thioredoxin [Arthrobacter sp. MYb216]
MKLELYTQPFCAPCVRTRQVVLRAAKLLPQLAVEEIDVVEQVSRGQEMGVASTPVIRLLTNGEEKFRGTDTPTLQQLLAAIAHVSD